MCYHDQMFMVQIRLLHDPKKASTLTAKELGPALEKLIQGLKPLGVQVKTVKVTAEPAK